MAIYNVHGGHSLYCRGASKYLDEVNEDRKVKNKVIELLRAEGHTVYDCTDDTSTTQAKNLSAIVTKCNAHNVNLDISIHLNAGGGTGVEVENYDARTKEISDRICKNISNELGIRNRGTKYMPNLYVLSNTKSLAILIECCFVDNMTDYKAWDVDKCAKAIVEGILGKSISVSNFSSSSPSTPSSSAVNNASTTTSKVGDVLYQTYANGKWWDYVTNYGSGTEGYAGVIGQPMRALRAYVKGKAEEVGYLEYRVHKVGGGWYNWQRDRNKDSNGENYAGDLKNKFDGLQMRIVGVSGRHVKYRVHCISKGWLDWVTDYGEGDNGYAGWYGYAIDAVQVKVI